MVDFATLAPGIAEQLRYLGLGRIDLHLAVGGGLIDTVALLAVWAIRRSRVSASRVP